MKRPFGKAADVEAVAESDRLDGAPHPRATATMFGHAGVETEMLELIRSGQLPQAILIGGREGIGKATLAWRIARFLALHPDAGTPAVQSATSLDVPMDQPAVQRIVALSHSDISVLRREWDPLAKKHYTEIKAEHARAATHVFQQSAAEGGYRICIVDCAEDLNAQSANALLKIIEEPPARALFLIIAHRPANVLPTIRSRCRKLNLLPLDDAALTQAVCAAGTVFATRSPADIARAVQRASGSVRQALQRLAAGDSASLDGVEQLLSALPRLDWSAVHRLADEIAPRAGADKFDGFVATTLDWLHFQALSGAPGGPARLAPFAQVWEKLRQSVRETDAYNLDKKPLILRTFAELAEAARLAGRV